MIHKLWGETNNSRHAGNGWELVGLVASGHSHRDILKMYPYLEREDIFAALSYAAWRLEETELPLIFQ